MNGTVSSKHEQYKLAILYGRFYPIDTLSISVSYAQQSAQSSLPVRQSNDEVTGSFVTRRRPEILSGSSNLYICSSDQYISTRIIELSGTITIDEIEKYEVTFNGVGCTIRPR